MIHRSRTALPPPWTHPHRAATLRASSDLKCRQRDSKFQAPQRSQRSHPQIPTRRPATHTRSTSNQATDQSFPSSQSRFPPSSPTPFSRLRNSSIVATCASLNRSPSSHSSTTNLAIAHSPAAPHSPYSSPHPRSIFSSPIPRASKNHETSSRHHPSRRAPASPISPRRASSSSPRRHHPPHPLRRSRAAPAPHL